jgi:hypothetical protein
LQIAESAKEKSGANTDADRSRLAKRIEGLLEQSPEEWRLTASVQAAAGRAYSELGVRFFEMARQHYILALGLEGGEQPASVAIIEQLANLEARLADDDSIEPGRAGALIDVAIGRIDGLLALVSSGDSMPSAPIARERHAIRASAYKCKAALLARAILRARFDKKLVQQFEDALERAAMRTNWRAARPKTRRSIPTRR